MSTLGVLYRRYGPVRINEAETIWKRALNGYKMLGLQNTAVANLHYQLAELYEVLDHTAEAEGAFANAADIRTKVLGCNDKETLDTIGRLNSIRGRSEHSQGSDIGGKRKRSSSL